MAEECKVEIKSSDILWRVFVSKSEQVEYGYPLVELSWGWTAGMTKQEVEELDDDVPSGHHTLQLQLKDAIELRDRLTEEIGKIEQELKDEHKNLPTG